MSVVSIVMDVGVDTIKDFLIVGRDIITLKLMTAGLAGIGLKLLADLL